MSTIKSTISSVILGMIPLFSLAQDLPFANVDEQDRKSAMNIVINLVNDQANNIYIQYLYPHNNTFSIPKLAKWNGDSLYIFSKKDGLRYGVVRNIVPDKDKGVWLGTDQGIAYHHDGKTTHYPLPKADTGFRKVSEEYARQQPLIQDEHGNIWALVKRFKHKEIYTYGSFSDSADPMSSQYYEVWSFKNGNWTKYDPNLPEGVKFVRTGKNPRNQMVVTALLLKYKKNKERVVGERYMHTISENGIKKNGSTLKDYQSKAGGDAFELQRGRKDYFTVSNFTTYKDSFFFAYRRPNTNRKRHIYQGMSISSQNLKEWRHYGMPGYEDMYEYNPLPVIGKRKDWDKMPYKNNFAHLVKEDPKEGVWIGMEYNYPGTADQLEKPGGGLIYYNEGNFKRYSPNNTDKMKVVSFGPGRELFNNGKPVAENASFDYITGVAYDKQGDLWIGSQRSGLFEMPEKSLSRKINQPNDAKPIVKVYPNPIHHREWVKVEFIRSAKGRAAIEVFNMQGKKVKQKMANLDDDQETIISTNNLRSGIYVLNIENAKMTTTKKIVIAK